MSTLLLNLLPIDSAAAVFENIRAHKFRSTLTMLGVVVGVTTSIIITSTLSGLRDNIVQLVESYGTNNIYAFHLSTGLNLSFPDPAERTRKPFIVEDGEAIKRHCDAVEDVANILIVPWNSLTYRGNSYSWANLQGVSANFAELSSLVLREGRFINEYDDRYRRNVIVIGKNIGQALFPKRDNFIGSLVRLNGTAFEIIGVLDNREGTSLAAGREDNAAYIPFNTARKVVPSNLLLLLIRAKSGQIREALSQSEGMLRHRRGVGWKELNNFDLGTADKFIQQFNSITMTVGIVAIAISSVGLIVGGMGVMNIMLVCVTERTHEIGIRKAVGARRRDIVWQFLFEAVTLTFLGGALGVMLAASLGYVIALIIPSLPATPSFWTVLVGLAVSVMVGLVFGVLPAVKASRLSPIECLRYE